MLRNLAKKLSSKTRNLFEEDRSFRMLLGFSIQNDQPNSYAVKPYLDDEEKGTSTITNLYKHQQYSHYKNNIKNDINENSSKNGEGNNEFNKKPSEILKEKINCDDFYLAVAKLDCKNAEKWKEMNEAMLAFFKLEEENVKIGNQESAVYSATMRFALHEIMVSLFEEVEQNPNEFKDGYIYKKFIQRHPETFKQNGACHLFFNNPIQSFKILLQPNLTFYTTDNVQLFIEEFISSAFGDIREKEAVEKVLSRLKKDKIVAGVIIASKK